MELGVPVLVFSRGDFENLTTYMKFIYFIILQKIQH